MWRCCVQKWRLEGQCMIISNGYLLHLVLLDGLAQQSKHATAKDGDYDEDDSFVIVNCEQRWDFFALLVKYLPFFTSTTSDWNFFAPQLFPNWTYCHYHLWNCYISVKGPGKKNVFFQAWRKRQTMYLIKPGSNSRSTDFEFWFPTDYKIFPPGSNSSVMAHNVSSISTNGSAHTIFLHRVKNIRWVGLF